MLRPHRSTILGLTLALLGAGFMLAADAHAQTADLADFARQAGFSTQDDLTLIIARLIRTAIGFLGIIVVVFIVYGGFLYLTAAGEEERIRKAKRTLVNAVIGAVIVMSSFAIAQFIVNAVSSATGNGGITGGGPGGGGGGGLDTGSSGGQFVMMDNNASCEGQIQNVRPQLVFSQSVSESSVQAGGITVTSGGTAVPGSFDVTGRRVSFIPDAVCTGVATERCLPANTQVDITLNPAILRSSGGRALSCTPPFACALSIRTGDGVDRTGPTIVMESPEDGASAVVGEILPLQARATDDIGVSTVAFTASGDEVFVAGPAQSTAGTVAPENFFSTDDTAWDTAGEVSGRSVPVFASAVDCAGHSADSSRITVALRAPSCLNGVQDTDLGETGVDCGGSGEFACGSCEGQSCTTSAECSTGVCEAGRCVSALRIDSVTFGDGAPGNFVTISGSGFGTAPGTVTFLGTEQGDSLPASVVSCGPGAQWSDVQIIVAVPTGAVDGPIRVAGTDGNTDRTDDGFGAFISDFNVNDVVRPGLCLASPAEGVRGTQVQVTGNNLGNAQESSVMYFDSTEAASYFSWGNTAASISVPALDARTYRLQAFVGENTCSISGVACTTDASCGGTGGTCVQNRQGSNRINFRVQSSGLNETPNISFVDSGWTACEGGSADGASCTSDAQCPGGGSCAAAPNFGPPGQAVTVVGSGFGTRVGTVRLVNAAGGAQDGAEAVADVEFPAACGDGLWRDDTAVILLPLRYTNGVPLETGTHQLRLVRSEDGVASNEVEFSVVTGAPGPSLCRLDPASGPASTLVDLIGQNFGTVRGTVTFTNASPVSPAVWARDGVQDVAVPTNAQTGPVSLRTASGAASNSIPFEVVDCREDAGACAEGTACCADGSCRLSCDEPGINAHYAWRFSTSAIPKTPEVLVQCSATFLSPSPWEGFSDSVCPASVITATFGVDGVPVVMDTSTLTTQNITVRTCASLTDCAGTGTAVAGFINAPTNGSSFVFNPSPALTPNTRYLVTITGGASAGSVRSGEGEPMAENYTWEFVTGDANARCSIGSVSVLPPEATITDVGGTAGFTGLPRAAGDQCVALACQASQGWTWGISGSEATLLQDSANVCQATATAVRETTSPLIVSANVAEANVPAGEAELTVDLVDPKVVSVVPSCGEACINALLVATFNTNMNEGSVEAAGAVRVSSCEDALCLDGFTPVPVSVEYRAATREAVITPIALLTANRNYRVTIAGAVTSASGVPLSKAGGNFRISGSGPLDYSWTFKTRNSAELCRVSRVDVKPTKATVKVVGARQEYFADAATSPDACSANGQRIVAEDILWSAWGIQDVQNGNATVAAAALLNAPTGTNGILRTTDLGVACTDACLLAGNPIKSGQSLCGNNLRQPGEDCDDGNTGSGDGCSAQCTNEGTAAPACGNGTIGLGEDCDDGNLVNGDGCSSRCVNEGSSSSLCGNGTRDFATFAGGEDCDIALDPVGCSARCVNLGTSPSTTAVCGNSTVNAGAGEACDDGNTVNGDGCSSVCLFEGNRLSSCGNGTVNAAFGEACDDGNTVNKDGCSSICLLEGSSALYGTPSFCGDTVRATGEACEAASNASIAVGPYSVAEALPGAAQELEEGEKFARTRLTATAEGVQGQAEFSVECSCQSDSACGVSGVGCGYSGCCSARPTVIAAVPTGNNTCRNPIVRLDVSEKLDESSFAVTAGSDEDRRVYLQAISVGGSPVTAANCPHELIAVAPAGNWFARIVDALGSFFGREARAQAVGTCVVPTSYRQVTTDAGGSSLFLDISAALAPNATYRLVLEHDTNISDGIREGVMSALGVGFAAPFSQTFTTGADVCSLDGVNVIDHGRTDASVTIPASSGFFSRAGEIHNVSATGVAFRNGGLEEIQPIPSLYAWDYQWASSPVLGSPEDIISVPAVGTGPFRSLTTATALPKNGEDNAIATATITVDNANTPTTAQNGAIPARTVTGSVDLVALLCENPWPSIAEGVPFVEDGVDGSGSDPSRATNFGFFYCRDAGLPGTADDLPAMTVTRVPNSPTSNVLSEFLFTLPETGDAMGVKVISNPEYLPADLWYDAQQFTGSPRPIVLDGYEGVRDGDTLYVLAANQVGDIFPNMHVIAMSENATSEAGAVFAQILTNWRFNTNSVAVSDANLCRDAAGFVQANGALVSCTSDLDCSGGATCDAEKAKLTRDTRRLSDVARIRHILAEYGRTHGHCETTKSQSCTTASQCPVAASGAFETCLPSVPTLSEGSFIRAMSTSKWPSWTDALTRELGTALPVDPLNAFSGCSGVGTDPETCFNATAGQFQCNVGSHVYSFQSSGGERYTFTATLEHDEALWGFPIDANRNDNGTIRVEY